MGKSSDDVKMDNGLEIYEKIMESQGGKTGDLLEVLTQGMHHNAPNSYHLAITAQAFTGGLEDIKDVVTERSALVQRHMRDAQQALRKIYQIAKDKGYKEITEIFEKEYHIGHAQTSPTQKEKESSN
jgi:predicted DNA-binding protein (UPF0278 family)